MKLLPEHVGMMAEVDDGGLRVIGVITGLGTGRSRKSAAHPWTSTGTNATVCIPPVKLPPDFTGTSFSGTVCVVVSEESVLRIWKGA